MPLGRRRRRGLLLGLVVLVAATGCVSAPATGTGAGTGAPASPARTTAPVPFVDPDQDFVDRRLAAMSTEQKVRSLLMLHVPGTDPARIQEFLGLWQPGGLILMGDNIPGGIAELAQLTASMTTDPALPLLTATDQEGNVVRRLMQDDAPGAEQLRFLPVHDTEAAFHQRGLLLQQAGIDINFGIVADVTDDPGSFIFDRSFGGDPTSAGERVAAAVAGESDLVLSTLKHFPGHGAAPGDSHSSIPQSDMGYDQWRAGEALSFQAGIDADAGLVMMGHLLYPAIDGMPASLSPRWHDILRDDLGFEGAIVTDDLLMLADSGVTGYLDMTEDAILALSAGATMLLFVLPAEPATVGVDPGIMITALVNAVETGRVTGEQLDDAVRRLLTMRRDLSEFAGCDKACLHTLR